MLTPYWWLLWIQINTNLWSRTVLGWTLYKYSINIQKARSECSKPVLRFRPSNNDFLNIYWITFIISTCQRNVGFDEILCECSKNFHSWWILNLKEWNQHLINSIYMWPSSLSHAVWLMYVYGCTWLVVLLYAVEYIIIHGIYSCISNQKQTKFGLIPGEV